MGKFGNFFKNVWGGIKKGATKVWDVGKTTVKKVGHILRPAADIAGKIGGFMRMLPGKAGEFGKALHRGGEYLKGLTNMLPDGEAKKKIQGAIDDGVNKGDQFINRGTEKMNQLNGKVQPWIDSGTRIARTVADGTDRLYTRL